MQERSNFIVGVGIIITSDNSILLAKRKNDHNHDSWTIPGSNLDFQEPVLDCAIRATREEADIEIDRNNIKELGAIEDIQSDEKRHLITHYVFYSIDKETVKPKWVDKNKFSTEWQWFDINTLPSSLSPQVANALNKFRANIFSNICISSTTAEQDIWSRQFRSGFWGSAAKGTDAFKSPVSFQDPVNTTEFSKYVHKEDPILDFGCGYGRVTNILYQYGYQNIIGLDFSEGMVNRGKEEYPHLKEKLKTLAPGYTTLPFADDSFSGITVFTVLNAIPTQTELEKLFQEFRRVLRPGGILYIYEFMITTLERDITRYKKFQDEHSNQNHPYGLFKISSGAIIRHFSKETIEALMPGFKILWHDQHQFVSMSGNPCLHGQWISQQPPKLLSK